MNRVFVHAGLIGLLIGTPLQAGPFQTYGGCGQSYVTSYAPTYTSGPYIYPAGYYPTTTSYTNYASVDYTFYRPASDLVNARLAQEAADQAVGKFKAELAQQAAAQQQQAKDAADLEWKRQITLAIQALGQQQAPVDPEMAKLRAENAQMRAALQRIIDAKQMPPKVDPNTPPTIPAPKDVPTPQPPPPGKTVGDANVIQAFKQVVDSKCIKCHGDGNPERMQLGHPERLTYADLSDCIARMASPVKELAMPKDKPGTVTSDDVLPFQLLQATAPRKARSEVANH